MHGIIPLTQRLIKRLNIKTNTLSIDSSLVVRVISMTDLIGIKTSSARCDIYIEIYFASLQTSFA